MRALLVPPPVRIELAASLSDDLLGLDAGAFERFEAALRFAEHLLGDAARALESAARYIIPYAGIVLAVKFHRRREVFMVVDFADLWDQPDPSGHSMAEISTSKILYVLGLAEIGDLDVVINADLIAGLRGSYLVDLPGCYEDYDGSLAYLTGCGRDLDGVIRQIWEEREEGGAPDPDLRSYDERRELVFRDWEQAPRLCERQIQDAAGGGYVFLLIVSASGAGKSSLARAGLLPRLAFAGDPRGGKTATFAPGSRASLTVLTGALHVAVSELMAGDSPASSGWAATVRDDRYVEFLWGKTATFALGSRAPLTVLTEALHVAVSELMAGDSPAPFDWAATVRDDRYVEFLCQPALVALKRDDAARYLPGSEGDDTLLGGQAEFDPNETDADTLDSGGGGDMLFGDGGNAFVINGLDTSTLTFAAYRALGGVQGAIERRVKEVLIRADAAAQADYRRLAATHACGRAFTEASFGFGAGPMCPPYLVSDLYKIGDGTMSTSTEAELQDGTAVLRACSQTSWPLGSARLLPAVCPSQSFSGTGLAASVSTRTPISEQLVNLSMVSLMKSAMGARRCVSAASLATLHGR